MQWITASGHIHLNHSGIGVSLSYDIRMMEYNFFKFTTRCTPIGIKIENDWLLVDSRLLKELLSIIMSCNAWLFSIQPRCIPALNAIVIGSTAFKISGRIGLTK